MRTYELHNNRVEIVNNNGSVFTIFNYFNPPAFLPTSGWRLVNSTPQITPISFPIFTNAAIALSRCSLSWAALS